MLMGTRSQKRPAIETSMCNANFNMSDACTAGSKLQPKKVKKVQQGLVTRNSGYQYKDSHGVDMVEYHVDFSKLFQDDADKETRFGGHLNVCIEMDKPLIFGDDKSIFKQYHIMKSAWVAPDGTTVLVPKDDAQGLMISAFQSRKIGFGVEISGEGLRKTNKQRRGQAYIYETAAVSKTGNSAEEIHC
jgi:DnaJ-class molecular chaperone